MQNLKSKYEQQEMKVSDGLWDRLEEKLDQVPAKERKPKMLWLRYVAVILLMIGLGGSFLMINHKSEININQEFANQTENQNLNQNLVPVQQSENDEVEKLIPEKIDNQKSAVENLQNSSTPLRMTESKQNQTQNSIPEKENLIQKEEPQINSQLDEKLAQNNITVPKQKVKYVSSSDLLFGVEIDKAKSETPKSAMGINTIKSKNDSDFPNPKRVKLFGITLYDKDSITTK